jgi:hypothetical protein
MQQGQQRASVSLPPGNGSDGKGIVTVSAMDGGRAAQVLRSLSQMARAFNYQRSFCPWITPGADGIAKCFGHMGAEDEFPIGVRLLLGCNNEGISLRDIPGEQWWLCPPVSRRNCLIGIGQNITDEQFREVVLCLTVWISRGSLWQDWFDEFCEEPNGDLVSA